MLPAKKELLTRRDVLIQLRRVGVRDLSQLKRDCREYEQFMAVNYDYEIVKNENPRSLMEKATKFLLREKNGDLSK